MKSIIKKSGNNTMKYPESNITAFIILVVIVSYSLLSPIVSYSASVSDDSISMDLELFSNKRRQLVEKTGPGVVVIVVYDDSGAESGRGSGFFIDRKGRIITNASILKDAYSAEVFSESNYYDDILILDRDKGIDVALIQVKATDEVSLELDFEYGIKPGERVIAIGKSSELKKTFSEGIISSINSIGLTSEVIRIQTTIPILSFRASKDGPLLNMSGKVIGLTSRAFPDSQNIDGIPRMPDYREIKAVGLTPVKRFLSEPDEAEQLHRAKSKIWPRWFIRSLKTAAIAGFITLYTIGFPKVIATVFVIIVIISIIQWLYFKVKKQIFNK